VISAAAAIAAALGDARRDGRGWRCRCPLHNGRSLSLLDGDGGCILVTCWGGCDRLEVLAELRRRGLLDGRVFDHPTLTARTSNSLDVARKARALAIWREAQPASGTIVERYLQSRGIFLDAWPAALRFHPRCPRPRDEAGNLRQPLPAMVAIVEHPQRGPVAVHATYLRPDGSGKADIPNEQQKASFGPTKGGAVRLVMPRAGEWLAVAEGIETTLSVATACAMPAWAALSAGGIRALVLPREAAHVTICADRDASGVGERAARDAAARWLAEGRRVKLALPPGPGIDFNDILRGVASTPIEEVADVAA
jgi:putative DNA primase/helicase